MSEASIPQNPSDGRRGARGRFWIAVLASLLGIAIFVGLGTWQVERLGWKAGIIRQVEERTRAAPQPLAAIEALHAGTGDVDYWPVAVRGRFFHAGERTVLSTHEGQSGWNVFTPLRLADGRLLFVNRGFVPYDLKDPAKRPLGLVEGEVEIIGLARNPPPAKPSSMTPDNDPDANVFFWKNVADMAIGLPAEEAGRILPFFVDAGPGRAPGGYPVGGVTLVAIPNDHLQYAVTWYALALVLAVMLVLFLMRARRGRRNPLPEPSERDAAG